MPGAPSSFLFIITENGPRSQPRSIKTTNAFLLEYLMAYKVRHTPKAAERVRQRAQLIVLQSKQPQFQFMKWNMCISMTIISMAMSNNMIVYTSVDIVLPKLHLIQIVQTAWTQMH